MHRWLTPVLAASLLLAACTAPPTPSPSAPTSSISTTPSASASGTGTPGAFELATLPRIDGSTANIPLISLVIQRLTGVSKADADNAVATSGTSGAYRALVDRSTDLLLVYEADAGTTRYVKDSGVALESHPIGRDALVFFTNATNPVTSLTTTQYRDIYTGALTRWKQVGGKDEKIVAFQRPEDSGSQALLRKYVVGKAKLADAPKEQISGDMGEIIDRVSSYRNSGNALGYSVFYYLSTMYAVDGITMLGVGGVQPSKATLADGSYPYTNDFFVVIRADEPAGSPARKVLAWLQSDAGRQAVTDAGYVPGK